MCWQQQQRKFLDLFFLFLSYWDTRQPKKYGEEFKKYKLICPFMSPKMMLFAHSDVIGSKYCMQ
jgi:hypothetical protein